MKGWASIGSLVGLGAILLGNLWEGGHLLALLQGPAFLIVTGGTLGATLLSFPAADIRTAFQLLPKTYQEINEDLRPLIREVVIVAAVARQEGVLAIEGKRKALKNALFARSLKYVIDGFEPAMVREIIDSEMEQSLEREENAGRVWEAAGAYAPTIGIIGAVLGLIHVMQNLDRPDQIGNGIAVAFVATLYGVALANLFFLPWGAKMKRQAQQRMRALEIVKVGVVSIQEGLNPHFIKEKLEVFLPPELRGTSLKDSKG